ncbi:hypothetical protein JXD38_04500 [candidate division WOR-3 bacterium]|nr:hypothetical protein [candidate division WOR-3 bacterium]
MFGLRILYNGITEGFRATRLEVLSCAGLMTFLSPNALLLVVDHLGRKA